MAFFPTPVVHVMKCWPIPFEALEAGTKTTELRVDDRDPSFAVGHQLQIREWEPGESVGTLEGFTGRELLFWITAVFREESAVPNGYVLMTIKRLTIFPFDESIELEDIPNKICCNCYHYKYLDKQVNDYCNYYGENHANPEGTCGHWKGSDEASIVRKR